MRIHQEINVEDRIKEILERFKNQKFNGVTIINIERQYLVGDGRRADIAVIKDDGKPIIIIETKKKYEVKGYSTERRFIPTSEEVVGQAVAYAAILKRKEIYVPFVATANDSQLALFMISENVEEIVDQEAIKEREYGRVIKRFYEFRQKNLIFHRPHNFSEEFFKDLLDTITGIYVKKYGVEEKKQEIHWILIEDLRSFVDFITPFIYQAIAPNNKFKEDIAKNLKDYSIKTGYSPTPEGLSREMAYVLMNKIVFYKVLERYYKLTPLEPLYSKSLVNTCNKYLEKLKEFFDKAVELTKDFELIFKTGIYDAVELIENKEVLEVLDWLIRLIDAYKIERLGDIVGFIYEELIPGEERHALGQFYTPKPIAELIVKWCIRSPDDKVLDPGCGSGTFLVEAYKRLAEMKLKRSFSEIRHVPEDVHRQILNQLYGIDINEFPAHLTAMNLAMKNVRAPSTETNILVKDYFTIRPHYKILAPYVIKTPEGEKSVEIIFEDFDAVIGNPPYTRWNEIPKNTLQEILKLYDKTLRKYRLHKFITGGAIPGIYIPWIIHSIDFLKERGRLGMIISDSWLQTEYGIGFLKYLTDNFKIHATIDISCRVFPVPLIGTCIILLEKCLESKERDSNMSVLMHIRRGKSLNVNAILKVIEEAKKGLIVEEEGYFIRILRQSDLKNIDFKPITLFFKVERLLEALALNEKVIKLHKIFQPSEGNTLWSIHASLKGGGAGIGGEEFYYISEEKAQEYMLNKYIGSYLKPLISSPDRLKYFTFTEKDWSTRKEYMFIANAPRSQLPLEIQNYIKLGETSILITKGPNKGRPVSESSVAKIRKDLGKVEIIGQIITFNDWYDLGGIVEAPIYIARGAQYWTRFVLANFQCALDDRILALIPNQELQFDEIELKALLAYLNSSFSQLQTEIKGRSTGGGMIELDVKPLSEFLILDVKKLPREKVEKLAQLFDKLEAKAREIGGADILENVFGSETAKELTSRSDIKSGVDGLFNTIIKEIDHEISRILGIEDLVENIRAIVLDLVERRLCRAEEAKRETIKGSEEFGEIRKPKTKRKEVKGINIRLDQFAERS
jgi:type I restriction-modification system DNA methylase subunit